MLTPTGTAINVAINVVKTVPVKSGKIPKCLSSNRGVHCVSVMNSQKDTSEKNFRVSTERTKIIPTVVSTEIKLHRIIVSSINFSDLIDVFAIFIFDNALSLNLPTSVHRGLRRLLIGFQRRNRK